MARALVVIVRILAAIGCVVASSPVLAQIVQLKAELRGENEVPSVQSPGRGALVASFDPATRNLSWTITYSGLPELPVAMHFHGPADPSRNAGIAVPVTGNFASPIRGFATLSESQTAILLAGNFYLNIHTVSHPAGELRGQVVIDVGSAASSNASEQPSAAARDQEQAAAAKAAEQEAAARVAAERAARDAAAAKAAAEKAAADKVAAEKIAQDAISKPAAPTPPNERAAQAGQPKLDDLDAKGCQAAIDTLISKESISFQSGSAVLSSSSGALLEKLKSVLLTCRAARIEISGHTDSFGSERANRALSQQRAQAILLFLSKSGVSAEKLVAIGYGSSRPIASNANAEDRARNRRIEFTVK